MSRCSLGPKKIARLRRDTGLPVVTALVRGDTDHRVDLCLNDGSIVFLFKDGTRVPAVWENGTPVRWRQGGNVEKW